VRERVAPAARARRVALHAPQQRALAGRLGAQHAQLAAGHRHTPGLLRHMVPCRGRASTAPTAHVQCLGWLRARAIRLARSL